MGDRYAGLPHLVRNFDGSQMAVVIVRRDRSAPRPFLRPVERCTRMAVAQCMLAQSDGAPRRYIFWRFDYSINICSHQAISLQDGDRPAGSAAQAQDEAWSEKPQSIEEGPSR